MMSESGRHLPEIVEAISGVLDELATLLRQHGEEEKAAWLDERRAVLQRGNSSPPELSHTFEELHKVVPGMGGLVDMHLSGGTPEESAEVNATLEGFAERLYDLTR